MFTLPSLPYAYDALEPVLSATTMRTHHDKHHRTYVETLNELLLKAGDDPESLEAIIARSSAEKGKLFNNAAQVWNHGFFWECMSPGPDDVSVRFKSLRDDFVEEGANHFASGWVWIAARGKQLVVVTTHDADTLAYRTDCTPLLVCDLWEHAYYLDHKNDRKGFLEQWFDECANWRFAEAQLAAAQGQGALYRYPRPRAGKGTTIGKDAETGSGKDASRPA